MEMPIIAKMQKIPGACNEFPNMFALGLFAFSESAQANQY